jgi:cytochrome c oxidase subunit 2
VGGLFAYCLYKFRVKGEIPTDAPLPNQGHGDPLFEIGVIFISIILVGIIAIPAVQGVFFMANLPADQKDAMTIKVHGMQWWWKFEYPQGFTSPNELVLPEGKAVRFELSSDNVIHSFWVPRLGGKMDVIPGQTNSMWLEGDKVGVYYGQCAEFCGESHAFMRFRVRVLSQLDYEAWIANQRVGAADPSYPKAMVKNQCLSCHAIRGAKGAVGTKDSTGGLLYPDLTHVGARASLAAGIFDDEVRELNGTVNVTATADATYNNLFQWISSPGYFKPGNKMYKIGYQGQHIEKSLTQDDAAIIAEYLSRLK